LRFHRRCLLRDLLWSNHDPLAFEGYTFVDELVELTEGKANAYETDPMGSLDYKALTGKSFAGMTYNELAEALGSFAFGE